MNRRSFLKLFGQGTAALGAVASTKSYFIFGNGIWQPESKIWARELAVEATSPQTYWGPSARVAIATVNPDGSINWKDEGIALDLDSPSVYSGPPPEPHPDPRIERLRLKKLEAIQKQDFDLAARIRDQEVELLHSLPDVVVRDRREPAQHAPGETPQPCPQS